MPAPIHQGKPIWQGPRKPLGYEQITSLSASVGLTVPHGAKLAIIMVEAQAVRWRDDGEAPTADVGMPGEINDIILYTGDLAAIRFIEQDAGAILNVSYYT